jgi:acyl transferase domain-containing protein
MRDLESKGSAGDIAIIGMSGRFPGAESLAEFWQNLSNGVESIVFYSPEELVSAGVNPAVLKLPNYVNAGSILADIDRFDASFFGFNPREAESMDPQQRIFMECAWHALEDAGYDPESYDGAIGVYAGCAMSTYLSQMQRNPDFIRLVGFLQVLIGNDKDYLTTHASYKLNLKGPSVSIQTTCSTSLVAVCLACHSLQARQCDMALAGGICIRAPQKTGYYYEPGGIYSPDGHCRVFDAQAQGMLFGNGVGIVVLKRLADAVADGDCIHAVIKGAAVNNDGSAKVSYTAPGLDGQARVIAMAQAMAGVAPHTITYIEAHGTATPVGDPIEIAALTKAFRTRTRKKNFCAVGSVKTNFGHLDHAAGIAGLIKTVLALKHKMLLPSLHFEAPNPAIDFANSPFYVNAKLSEWKKKRFPRRAGVSAFGIGGTNAHVILEEAPPVKNVRSYRPSHLLVLSARTSTALETATANLAAHLKQHPQLNLADIAYTQQVGRKAFGHRRVLVCHDLEDAVNALDTVDPKRVLTGRRAPQERPVFFMFSGQGAQYVNMARDLYRIEPTFREQVDRCAELLQPQLGFDLRRVLYPPQKQTEKAAEQLQQTAITQPALFVIEYALARLWMEWGVRPRAMIGHSIGEYVAACLAGVFSLDAALELVATRGRLMQELPGGAMLSVPLSEPEVQALLTTDLYLAAVNEHSMCVVSGSTAAIEQLATQLTGQGLECRRLHTSHAFHSGMMEPILEPFMAAVQKVDCKPPQIPFVSNVTGTWITAAEAMSPVYWASHIRQAVRFADGLETLLTEQYGVLLEIGPGQTLTTFARRHPAKAPEQRALSSLRHPHERQADTTFILNSLGRLWLAGVEIDWSGFYTHEQRQRVSLPTYPFERQRYWIEPVVESASSKTQDPSLKKLDIADWFYIPSWKRTILAWPATRQGLARQRTGWLVFADPCGVGSRLIDRLEQEGQDVVTVSMAEQFAKIGEQVYTLNPREPQDYHTLLKELFASNQAPEKIVHCWSVTASEQTLAGSEGFERCQDLGFYSLLYLAQALAKQNMTAYLRIGIVSNGIHLVTGKEALWPGKATVLGACKTIPQEYPNLRCQNIDIVIPPAGSPLEVRLPDYLIDELMTDPRDTVVAYRAGQRWVQLFEPVHFEPPAESQSLLRENGVYLITGGLGNICLALAEELARTVRARLVLIGRSAFPAREDWSQWLERHGGEDQISRRIRRIQTIESLGAQVLVCSAEVADEQQMQRVIEQTYAHFGELHGVIHGAGTVVAEAFFAIDQAGRDNCNLHFQPKVRGLLVLEKVLRGKELDFWLLLSSMSSILAGLGFVAYSAANNFLDAFASKRNRATGIPWINVNWDAWELQENWALAAMLPSEGIETFRRILSSSSLRQVLVSISDLQARIDKWINLKFQQEVQEGVPPAGEAPLHERPELEHDYVAPRNEVEQSIAAVWQELLGVQKVGIHDNFFTELGGHSLLATKLVARLRNQFQVDLPLRRFFEAPTVAELAAAIAALKGESSAEAAASVPGMPAEHPAQTVEPAALSVA